MAERSSPGGVVGMKAFSLVWFGQFVSMVGSGAARFAFTIWAWEMTGSATALALVGFFSFAPSILVSPFAGALVDRWNRKLVMMMSDFGAALATLGLLGLVLTGRLELWHLCLAGAVAGSFDAFQFPAFTAAITQMVSKEHYSRTSGMLSMAHTASGVLAPMLGALLLAWVGIVGILYIDLATFLCAFGTLLAVHVPGPTRARGKESTRRSLWSESMDGFRFIVARPSLFRLQLVFFGINLVASFSMTVLAPMILAKTDNNAALLGSVQSAGALGAFLGGLLLSIWGGPKRKVFGVLGGMALSSVTGTLLMGLSQGFAGWLVASFFFAFYIPILNGCNQAIWQVKVPGEVQGRVFAARRMVAQATVPIAMLIAGPMADRVFEPALSPGSSLAALAEPIVGSGPGAGMGLMFVLSGIFGLMIALVGALSPAVRGVEALVPDADDLSGSGGDATEEPAVS